MMRRLSLTPWTALLIALALAAAVIMAVTAWYADASQWQEARPGWEERLQIRLWPPEIAIPGRRAD
jgi:hypothetical protein